MKPSGEIHVTAEPLQSLTEKILSHRNLLTLREAAELLSLSYKTIFEMASRGRIPAFQFGSAWRVDPIEFAAWAEEHKFGPAQALRVRLPTQEPVSRRRTSSETPTGVGVVRRSAPRGPIGRTGRRNLQMRSVDSTQSDPLVHGNKTTQSPSVKL